jgi:hypothetical protein
MLGLAAVAHKAQQEQEHVDEVEVQLKRVELRISSSSRLDSLNDYSIPAFAETQCRFGARLNFEGRS